MNEVSRSAPNIAIAVGTGGLTIAATAPPVAVGIAVVVLAACIGLAFVRAAGSADR